MVATLLEHWLTDGSQGNVQGLNPGHSWVVGDI